MGLHEDIGKIRTALELCKLVTSRSSDFKNFLDVAVAGHQLEKIHAEANGKGPADDKETAQASALLSARASDLSVHLPSQSVVDSLSTIAHRDLDPGPHVMLPLLLRAGAEAGRLTPDQLSSLPRTVAAMRIRRRHELRDLLSAAHGAHVPPAPSPARGASASGLTPALLSALAPADPGAAAPPQTQPPAAPAGGLAGRARAFWQDRLVGPARTMTGPQLGIALGVGIWGGLLPVPGATSFAALGLLAAARAAGRGGDVTAAVSALAVGVNLAMTPAQLALLPVFMMPFAPCRPDALVAALATLSAVEASACMTACFAKAAAVWAVLAPPAVTGIYFAVVAASAAAARRRSRQGGANAAAAAAAAAVRPPGGGDRTPPTPPPT